MAVLDVATDAELINLPAPRQSGGKPLCVALKERRSEREFRSEPLSLQMLSNLLWAAFGVTHADGRRTAPSAHTWQEIDIYVAMKSGLYLYDARTHTLRRVLVDDVRAATGEQAFVADSPLNLIYVADLARVDSKDRTEQRFYTAIDAGFVAQNVYLFCASEGLATVVRGLIDRRALAERIQLRPNQRIIVAQTVGYAKA